jgi:hypothetical protein
MDSPKTWTPTLIKEGSSIAPRAAGKRQAGREPGHLGQVPQSTDPAERPIYGRLDTYRRTEPKGGKR